MKVQITLEFEQEDLEEMRGELVDNEQDAEAVKGLDYGELVVCCLIAGEPKVLEVVCHE